MQAHSRNRRPSGTSHPRSLAVCLLALLAIATVALDIAAFDATAADIRLRSQVTAGGPAVTLADVATIAGADSEQLRQLSAIELVASPPPGQQAFLRVRQIEDLLLLRGINLVEHNISGASQVVIRSSAVETTVQQPVTPATMTRARRAVAAAVIRYLQDRVSAEEMWHVDVSLQPDQIRAIQDAGGHLTVAGGLPPWTGSQFFEITLPGAGSSVRLGIQARVSLPPAVVITTRPIARGALVHAADVQLVRGTPTAQDGDAFESLESVIGRETTRGIGTGKVVQRDMVRLPLLVRQNDVVTVYVRSPGINIRSVARAVEEGSHGELITVESLQGRSRKDRKTFFARVCGMQEVEVYAHPVRAAQSPVDRSVATGVVPASGVSSFSQRRNWQ